MKQSLVCKLCLWLVLAVSNYAFAQQHSKYKAPLDSVEQNSFYNISLSPAIIAKCKNELDDLRIRDNKNNEIPYLLYTESARPNEEAFTEFPLTYSDDRTTVYINNILPNSLDKLFLLIKNSEAQRLAILSGSDDQLHWFVIKDKIILQNEFTADSDAFVQSVSFPKSSFKYFRIAMPGKNVLPLNIIKAGVYRNSFTNSVYDTLPLPRITQKDSSNKHSYVYFTFGDDYIIDKLVLSFSGGKFYKRSVVLYEKNTINSPVTTDTISSAKPAAVDFHTRTNRLLLVIDNRDNAPLIAANAVAMQLHTSVTAYLEKEKRYALYFGDSAAMAPSYDLQYFDDSIGNKILPLRAGSIININANPVADNEKEGSQWVLRSIILAVLASLIYFSFRMMRDLSHKKDTDADL